MSIVELVDLTFEADELAAEDAMLYAPGEPVGAPCRVKLAEDRPDVRLGQAGAVAGRLVATLRASEVARLPTGSRLELDDGRVYEAEPSPTRDRAGVWTLYLRPLRVPRP